MTITMKNNRWGIQNINDVAEYNVERAVDMVNKMNELYGTQYCIIDRRVCYFEDEFGAMIEPYKPGCYYRDAEFAY